MNMATGNAQWDRALAHLIQNLAHCFLQGLFIHCYSPSLIGVQAK